MFKKKLKPSYLLKFKKIFLDYTFIYQTLYFIIVINIYKNRKLRY